MANHISNLCHLFVILVLVVAGGSIVLVVVDGSDVCSDALGACGPVGDCDQKCKAKHSGGQGSCDFNLCTCNYGCPAPPSPPERKCSTADCNANCASKFNQGVGFVITLVLSTCVLIIMSAPSAFINSTLVSGHANAGRAAHVSPSHNPQKP